MISSGLRGQKAPSDPWGGWSMEWLVSSPPPTPSHDPSDLPELKFAEIHDDSDPGFFGRMIQWMMIPEDGEDGGEEE